MAQSECGGKKLHGIAIRKTREAESAPRKQPSSDAELSPSVRAQSSAVRECARTCLHQTAEGRDRWAARRAPTSTGISVCAAARTHLDQLGDGGTTGGPRGGRRARADWHPAGRSPRGRRRIATMVVAATPSAAPHGGARSPSSVLPRRGGPNGPPDRLGRARRRRAATRATIHPLPLRSGPLRARASMVRSPPVAEHAEAAFCGARAAWATP